MIKIVFINKNHRIVIRTIDSDNVNKKETYHTWISRIRIQIRRTWGLTRLVASWWWFIYFEIVQTKQPQRGKKSLKDKIVKIRSILRSIELLNGNNESIEILTPSTLFLLAWSFLIKISWTSDIWILVPDCFSSSG